MLLMLLHSPVFIVFRCTCARAHGQAYLFTTLRWHGWNIRFAQAFASSLCLALSLPMCQIQSCFPSSPLQDDANVLVFHCLMETSVGDTISPIQTPIINISDSTSHHRLPADLKEFQKDISSCKVEHHP